jgi:hypothetical protein
MPKRISREDLIGELQRLADELGKTPGQRDMNEHGAHVGSTYVNRFGSWNDAVESAGLKRNAGGGPKYSNDDLLYELRRVADIAGRPPTVGDMEEHGDIDPSTFTNRFGKWSDAVETAGYELHRQGIRITDQELIRELQRLADELNHTPTTAEMKEHGEYSHVSYIKRFDSWNNAIKEAGLETRSLDRESLRADLRLVGEAGGEYITMDEYDDAGEYSSDTLVSRFGSWSDALDAADLPSEPRRDRAPTITEEELFNELQRLADELGKTPTFNDLNDHGEYSGATYIRRFGSWNAAIDAAGFEPNESITGNKIPRGDLLDDLRRVKRIVGREPLLKDLKAHGEYSKNAYYNEFGSWPNAVNTLESG